MKAVVKLSGSVFDDLDNYEYLKGASELFDKFVEEGNRLAIVVGGGKRAREVIELARKIGATEDVLDELGIDVTRINAKIMISSLRNSYPKVIENLREADVAFSFGKIPVAGGLSPGHSTNAVAALLAEHLKADIFINSTKAGGIFNKDPEKYPDAVLLEEVTVDDLKSLLKGSFKAGTYELMDEVSLGIIERSRIKTVVVGTKISDLRKALYSEKVGSLIVFERGRKEKKG